MLSTGIFPDRLKYSEIKPIYKKGDKTLITNYRPISLLTVFSNIFEKVIYKRLYYLKQYLSKVTVWLQM
jgi:hypothetical protein